MNSWSPIQTTTSPIDEIVEFAYLTHRTYLISDHSFILEIWLLALDILKNEAVPSTDSMDNLIS